MNLQVANFPRCECSFLCPVTWVPCLVYIVMCVHPLQVVVLLCTSLPGTCKEYDSSISLFQAQGVQKQLEKQQWCNWHCLEALSKNDHVNWVPRLTLLDLWTNWTYKCAWKLFACGGLTLHQREPVSTTMVLRCCWFHQRNSISEIVYTHEKSTDKDQEMNTWSASSCSPSGVWSSTPWSWGAY